VARRARGGPRLVTLSSDLGAEYSAQVKAVLAQRVDPGRVVELTHDLPAHGVAEGAFLLEAMAKGFPAGTVHLAIVDPGVGGERAPLAVECSDGSRLVGPDNGLLYPLAETLGLRRAYRIDPSRVRNSPRVGTTFDARDLFAPAAARLARGARAASLGPAMRPRVFRLPRATRRSGGASGEVVHVDRYGNLISNIPTGWVGSRVDRLVVRVGGRRRSVPWTRSYEAAGPGRILALGSSFGTLEVAVGEGNAARRLGARVGATIDARWVTGASSGSQSVNSERPRRR